MTGKTHRVGGMLCCLAGYSVLESKGMLLGNVNPLLQLSVMYPFAIYGSVMSDLDHHWESAPSKDIFSWFLNKVLHITTGVSDSIKKKVPILKVFDAKHRSWQTHSDIFLLLMCILFSKLLGLSASVADAVIIKLIFVGLILGIISHLVLDMLTPEGIWSILFVSIRKITKLKLPEKVTFVPKKKFFATDGPWENLVRKVLW